MNLSANSAERAAAVWERTAEPHGTTDYAAHRAAAEQKLDTVRAMNAGKVTPDISGLLRDYVLDAYGYVDFAFYMARRMITEIGRKIGTLPPDGSFFDRWGAVKPEHLAVHCPELKENIYPSRGNADLAQQMLLEPCVNEVCDVSFPSELVASIRRQTRAGLWLYSTDDAAVYTHPFQYQIMARDESTIYDSGSPRRLSRQAMALTERVHLDRPIVVIQDRFLFSNFSHFLFDGVTRILHYLDRMGHGDHPVFLLGGFLTEYQDIVLTKLAERTGIRKDSFVFPRGKMLLTTSQRVHWFSDQVEVYSHPAQMAHPQSLSSLGSLVATLPAASCDARRIYISRGDATRRRVLNEAELIGALEKCGFRSVRLGDLSIPEQFGLFRNAEIVVGPHGMGFTHIMMSQRLGRMVELFPQWVGTAAYAHVAAVGGVDYKYCAGTLAKGPQGDFSIDVSRVLHLIGPNKAPLPQVKWRKAANLIAHSRSFHEFVAGPRAPNKAPAEITCEPPVWGLQARVHSFSKGIDNLVVGSWENLTVIPGQIYTLSAWVSIPAEFNGELISMRIWKAEDMSIRTANLTLRGVWQRVSATGRATGPRCSAQLLVSASKESWVASAGWQLERGKEATSYVSTG